VIQNPSFTECVIRLSKERNRHQFFEDEDNLEFLEIYEDIISKLNILTNWLNK
jgi:hypothetical protein